MPEAFESVPVWMMIAGFLLMLGPLVTLHELGHYLVGRWFGVGANVFSVGFGKELFGRTDSRGTRWRLSAIPLGGYVQFKGDMNPASVPDPNLPSHEEEGAFQSAKLWQRALIVAAGPVTNFLIAVLIFAGFAMAYGVPVASDPARENFIAEFADSSPAREAGMQIGDRIVAIDGETMADFRQVQQTILLFPNKSMDVEVEREGERLSLPVTAQSSEVEDRFGNKMTIGLIGVMTRPTERIFEKVGPISALAVGVRQSFDAMGLMVTGIAQIIGGDRSVKELGGPLTIAKFSGEQLSLGPAEFVGLIAFISINLAFINLLPIPTLDGGHLAFYAVEAIRRKPASPRSQEWAFRTGMAFVLALMLFVTLLDIAKLPIFGS